MSLLALGNSFAGDMFGELMAKAVGGDLPGVLQLALGMIDQIFGSMKPEEAVMSLSVSRQMIDTLLAKYAALVPQPTPAPEPTRRYVAEPTPEEDAAEGEEINHLVHEGRAEKRGVTWNRARYRYETQEGKPLFWNRDHTYREVTEEEWAQNEAVLDEAARHQHPAG